MIEFLTSLKSESVIALASVFIAMMAFILMILQHRATVRHNKLSVKPILSANFKIEQIILEVANEGLGVAELKTCWLHGKNATLKLEKSPSHKEIDDFMLNSLPQLVGLEVVFHVYAFSKSRSIKPTGSIVLLDIDLPGLEKNKYADAHYSIVNSIGLSITFDSIYGQRFSYSRY